MDRSSVRYVSHRPDQVPLLLRIRDLAATRTRYGYFRIYILLRREGWLVNYKRVDRSQLKRLRQWREGVCRLRARVLRPQG